MQRARGIDGIQDGKSQNPRLLSRCLGSKDRHTYSFKTNKLKSICSILLRGMHNIDGKGTRGTKRLLAVAQLGAVLRKMWKYDRAFPDGFRETGST